MAKDRLEVSDGTVRLIAGGRTAAEAACEAIDKLFVVVHEDPLFQGDEPFYVAVFADRLWVVPDDTPGIGEFLGALAPALDRGRRVYRAVSPPRPFAWRKRVLGLLPLFPIPRLAAHPLSTIPAWREEGPFAPAEVAELAAELGLAPARPGETS